MVKSRINNIVGWTIIPLCLMMSYLQYSENDLQAQWEINLFMEKAVILLLSLLWFINSPEKTYYISASFLFLSVLEFINFVFKIQERGITLEKAIILSIAISFFVLVREIFKYLR